MTRSGRTAWAALASGALALGLAGSASAAGFSLSSPDVKPGSTIKAEQVFKGFGCTGSNISPALHWSGAPAGTKSFALTIYDPDAPTGSGWWHWVITNIPATATGLAKNAGDVKANLAPAGSVQSRTDFGVPGYGGPCPPQGDKPHRYVFKLFAVDVDHLDVTPDSSAAYVGFNLHFHTKGVASFTAKYGR
ncbi:MAG TPA: YbhB/YbcL family Raf kinase inhibitor-like protein [Stellaceae bacterium]|nr:YbhB/YbcL family Raf kinase inhibitor-like protein [Stellaceae bacterium]